MEIEIVTTKKKLTKSMVKQFEPLSVRKFNMAMNYDDAALEGKLLLVCGVFKSKAVILKDNNGDWSYLNLYKYTPSRCGKDLVFSGGGRKRIGSQKIVEEFLNNVARLEKIAQKIII